MPTRYDRAFFSAHAPGAEASAREILPLLIDLTGARSLIDVGCGIGAWLAVATDLGVERTLGIDGPYVTRNSLLIPSESFRAMDLSQPFTVDESFDLAICLEVAEHLPRERGDSFVADLISLAPWVAFSAAVPGQGGVNHVNEQWSDYWHGVFASHGWVVSDVIRAAVWDSPEVEPPYAQNTYIYGPRRLPSHSPLPSRVIHPRLFEARLRGLQDEIGPLPWFRRLRAKVQLRGRLGLHSRR